MANAGDELTNPVTGQRIVFRKTAADTGGELLEMESSYVAGARPAPPHYHPNQEERMRVLSGRVRAVLRGQERILEEGDEVVIPAGTPHDFGGHPDSDGRIVWQTRPALRTEQFMETGFGLARDGKVSQKTGVPGLLQVAVMAKEFDAEFRLVKPARAIQLILFAILAPLGRARGYRAVYPEYSGPA